MRFKYSWRENGLLFANSQDPDMDLHWLPITIFRGHQTTMGYQNDFFFEIRHQSTIFSLIVPENSVTFHASCLHRKPFFSEMSYPFFWEK